MTPIPHLVVIIPVHNRINHTRRCVDSILNTAAHNIDLEILIIDDGSTDGTYKFFSELSSKISVEKGSGTLFWTGAVRLGIESILNRRVSIPDYICLANNDTIFNNRTLPELIEFLSSINNKGIACSLALAGTDLPRAIKSASTVENWYLNKTKHWYLGLTQATASQQEPQKVDFVTARCLLHPTALFQEVGNYDAHNFPHYGGDDEFGSRMKKHGYGAYLVPASTVEMQGSIEKQLSFYDTLFSIRSSMNLKKVFCFSMIVPPKCARVSYFLVALIKSLVVACKNSIR